MTITPIPWPQFTAELLEQFYGPSVRAAGTRREMMGTFRLIERLGVTSTADLTADLVSRLIADQKERSPATMAKHLRIVRICAHHAVANGQLSISPFAVRPLAQWVRRSGPPRPKLWFPAEAVRAVLDLLAADIAETAGWPEWRARRLQALTATVAYCGLRKSEALWLHAADVNLDARFIALVARGKAMKTEAAAQPVPIPEACVPILASWLEHRLDAPPDFPIPDCPWLFPTLNRRSNWTSGARETKPLDRLQQAAMRAGYPNMTFQSLRASWATHAENAGMSALQIQRILRHTNLSTQAWYRAADLPAITAAVKDFQY